MHLSILRIPQFGAKFASFAAIHEVEPLNDVYRNVECIENCHVLIFMAWTQSAITDREV